MPKKHPLTEGALRVIMRGGYPKNPILQVLGSKRIVSGSSDRERFRILLSDGKNAISFAMLTTRLNDNLTNGELTNNSIIKAKRYVTGLVNDSEKGNKRVLVILEMETLVSGVELGKIGSPMPLEHEITMDELQTGMEMLLRSTLH